MPGKDRARMIELEALEAETFGKMKQKARGNKKKVPDPPTRACGSYGSYGSATP